MGSPKFDPLRASSVSSFWGPGPGVLRRLVVGGPESSVVPAVPELLVLAEPVGSESW